MPGRGNKHRVSEYMKHSLVELKEEKQVHTYSKKKRGGLERNVNRHMADLNNIIHHLDKIDTEH